MTNREYIQLNPHFVDVAELSTRGFTRTQINKIAPPDEIIDTGYHISHFWRRERFEGLQPLPKRKVRDPFEVDLLQAIWTVNRSAKRYRDAAQSYYQSGKASQSGWGRYRHVGKPGCFTLATLAKEKKEELYDLKDAGIAAAFRGGRLTCEGRHGNMASWTGDGYRFHSCLIEKSKEGVVLPCPSEYVFIEAKPKSAKESRLRDAEYTISLLPEAHTGDDLTRLDAPILERMTARFEPDCLDEDHEDDYDDDYYDDDYAA